MKRRTLYKVLYKENYCGNVICNGFVPGTVKIYR